MKLNKDQIQIIDNYLISKNVTYADLKLEILDHMISDVENEMESNQLSFDKALNKTLIKWKSSFDESFSFWLGAAYVRPKIIISKLINTLKPLFFKVVIGTVLITALLYILDAGYLNLKLNSYKEILLMGIYLFSAVNALVLGYWAILIYRSKLNTSFSFLYYRQVLIFCLYPFIITDTFLYKEGTINFFSLGFIILIAFITLIGRMLFKSHFNTIETIRQFA